jgi:hypothetical protein
MIEEQDPGSIQVPEPKELRGIIEGVSRRKIRNALKFQYLTASRISEVCGKWAITGRSFETTIWKGEENPVLLFKIKSKTMKEIPRSVALPLDPKYEPWTNDLLIYCLNRQTEDRNKDIFNVSPRTIQRYAQKHFKGLSYYIEKYGDVPGHYRNILTHGLRHIRATELLNRYGFDGIDITIFCGWSITREVGMPKMAKRYVYGQWARYFPKLLIPYS